MKWILIMMLIGCDDPEITHGSIYELSSYEECMEAKAIAVPIAIKHGFYVENAICAQTDEYVNDME